MTLSWQLWRFSATVDMLSNIFGQCVRESFRHEPDFGVTSVDYASRDPIAQAKAPG